MLVTLANAADLSVWANRIDAPGDLPDLVRRLILTTVPDVNRLQFRAGEGTRYPGWDGIVKSATGNAFVPAGVSVWELGTRHSPKSKAEEDLVKRTADPLGVDPSEAIFVFVTPRHWRDKDPWGPENTSPCPWRAGRRLYAHYS